MPIKVLVVDDSSFFRRRVSEIIEQDSELTVVDTANNGKEAVEKAAIVKPDVITMDVEMPVLDGISAVRQIMEHSPTSILMFSSLTHDGAKATLDALDAGALDFLPKKFEDIARNREEATGLLLERIRQLGKRKIHFRKPRVTSTARPSTSSARTAKPLSTASSATRTANTTETRSSIPARSASVSANKTSSPVSRTMSGPKIPSGQKYKLVAIGTSTGGPVALQKILTELPANFPHPILLIQHMPAAFTSAFAARLNSMCQISVKEAENGDVLKPKTAYLAPGGKQMMVEGTASQAKLKIIEDTSQRLTYKPSVDVTFGTAAKVYRDAVLAIVLTGMGADGKEGARMLKSAGGRIWAQDEATCVVYGMPQAVTNAGISERNLPLEEFGSKIRQEIGV